MIKEEQSFQEEKEEREEFYEQTILLSCHQGIEYRPVVAHMCQNSGLGYRQTSGGNFQMIVESGYTLCRYVLPTRWQIEEACRRLAPCANYRGPADQIFPAYRQEHGGEKLGKVLETVFLEVHALGGEPPREERSLAEQLETLKDWVLERGDASHDQPPPLAF